eukprot:10259473-Lingulodinium_polyedra.AAC.1
MPENAASGRPVESVSSVSCPAPNSATSPPHATTAEAAPPTTAGPHASVDETGPRGAPTKARATP